MNHPKCMNPIIYLIAAITLAVIITLSGCRSRMASAPLLKSLDAHTKTITSIACLP